MKVVHVDEQAHCTMLTLQMDDGALVGHALPVGVLEYRAGQWELDADDTDVDPLELILVECHLQPEDVSPYDGDYAEQRAKMLDAVAEHRGKIEWGKATNSSADQVHVTGKAARPAWSRDAVRAKCQLPPGVAEVVRDGAKTETRAYRAGRRPDPSAPQVMAERAMRMEELAAGYARRNEEVQAEEFVSAMNDDRKQHAGLKSGSAPVDSVTSRKGSGSFRVEW